MHYALARCNILQLLDFFASNENCYVAKFRKPFSIFGGSMNKIGFSTLFTLFLKYFIASDKYFSIQELVNQIKNPILNLQIWIFSQSLLFVLICAMDFCLGIKVGQKCRYHHFFSKS